MLWFSSSPFLIYLHLRNLHQNCWSWHSRDWDWWILAFPVCFQLVASISGIGTNISRFGPININSTINKLSSGIFSVLYWWWQYSLAFKYRKVIINTEFSEYRCLSLIVHAISNKLYYCSLTSHGRRWSIVSKACNKQETNVLKFENLLYFRNFI